MLPAPGRGLLEVRSGEGMGLGTAAAVADALDGLALRHCGGGVGDCVTLVFCFVSSVTSAEDGGWRIEKFERKKRKNGRGE
jgi:hypothetical protein